MGAMVIRKKNESNSSAWLHDIRTKAKNTQSTDLHFRTLSDRQKKIICSHVATLEARLFVVISNKRNMRQYNNKNASYVTGHKHWFYWWMSRLLLERVTGFCAAINHKENTPNLKLQIEFSRRKDLKEHDFTGYFSKLWTQGQSAFLNKRQIDWSVFDFNSVYFYDHKTRAGLQFADIVASSFYQAVNIHPHGTCCADYAKLLKPRIHCLSGGRYLEEGFTVWPTTLANIGLTSPQKEVFRHYGFPEDRLTKAAARSQSPRSW